MGIERIPEAQEYILHWGEMGSHWGVNRSVSQIHALLYLSDRPLHAEEICEALKLARSNVSTALKELQSYNIVRRTHVVGDRRDHFVAELDLWDMFTAIVAERKRREIDPIIARLAELSYRMEGRPDVPTHVRCRIATLTGWYNQVSALKKSTLIALMKLGAKVARFVPGSPDKPTNLN